VPQQTLYALNSEFIQDRAIRVAGLAKSAAESDDLRVIWLYQHLFAREPDGEELNLAIRYVSAGEPAETAPDGDASATTDRWNLLAHALLASNEFLFVD
jgi:hypothetical protein